MKTNGFEYIQVHTKEEFTDASVRFVNPSEKPILLEIITTPDNEREASTIHATVNMQYSEREQQQLKIKGYVKNAVTPILGEGGLKIIRKIFPH